MATGKIYDSEELKRIDLFMSSKDQQSKNLDEQKTTTNKNVFIGLLVISAIVGSIFVVNYMIKK